VVNLYKNNYAVLKVIHVGIFLLYFIKISFPVYFLFKWRQTLSRRPRISPFSYILRLSYALHSLIHFAIPDFSPTNLL